MPAHVAYDPLASYHLHGEHKKYMSKATFVDILAMHADFCLKFLSDC